MIPVTILIIPSTTNILLVIVLLYIDSTTNNNTANLPNIVDFRGFDSSTILILRGGIPRPIGDFLESLSRAMLVGTMLVGRLGVKKGGCPVAQEIIIIIMIIIIMMMIIIVYDIT